MAPMPRRPSPTNPFLLKMLEDQTVSLISRWYLKPGCEEEARKALTEAAKKIYLHEPGTLTYLIHQTRPDDSKLISLPSVSHEEITFFEQYRDRDSFLAHVGGEIFTTFLEKNGHLFQQSDGRPFLTVSFLSHIAGFKRSTLQATEATDPTPGVMVEVIAEDQAKMKAFYQAAFNWQYEIGGSGFAYVRYPQSLQPRLAGIGEANAAEPGFAPGSNFYLQVDDLAKAIEKVIQAGGKKFVSPTAVDGYEFAMVKDPEDNAIGLIKPFS